MHESRRRFLRALLFGTAGSLATAKLAASETANFQHPMRTIISEGFGRIIILSFDRGEKLLEGIRNKLKQLGVKNAVLVSAIGTFQKARFHRILTTDIKPKDEVIEVDGPMELAAVDGVVADGEPHFHMVFQDMNRAYAAHLEEGSVVCYLAEIVLAEIKGVELARIRNEHGIALLQEKK